MSGSAEKPSMRRRIALLGATLLAPLALSGCIGIEGKQAETLLQRASAAQDALKSERFVVRFDFVADGHKATMAMQGGGYLKGPHAGDFYFTMTGAGVPELRAMDVRVMRRGNVAAVRVNGQTQRMAAPAVQEQFGSPTDMLGLAKYVKSVSVDEANLGDRPADRIVGTLDSNALLNSTGDLAKKVLESSGVQISDVRAVLFVPRDTHLVEVMFADLDITGEGHEVHMHISIATSGANKPVAIPAF
jgi:hypothetical protein